MDYHNYNKKCDVLLFTYLFDKFINVSNNEFAINPLYCVSSPAYIRQCGLKYTGTTLQTLQVKDMTSLLENNISGGKSSITGGRYVKSDEKKRYCISMLLIYLFGI